MLWATCGNAQDLLLTMHRGPYGMPEIEPELATCKASTFLLYYHSDPSLIIL